MYVPNKIKFENSDPFRFCQAISALFLNRWDPDPYTDLGGIRIRIRIKRTRLETLVLSKLFKASQHFFAITYRYRIIIGYRYFVSLGEHVI